MEDSIRRRAYASPQHSDLFEEMYEELSGINAPDVTDVEVEKNDVDEPSPDTVITSRFAENTAKTDSDDFELGRVREKAFSSESVSFEGNEGVDFSEGADTVKQRINRLEQINKRLANEDVRRRYVVSKTDTPDSATVYEDSIAEYFYKMPFSVRPSDVSKVVEQDSWFEIPQNERVRSTVVLLDKAYPWVLRDAKSETEVQNFLERALVTEVDELESEDVFSVDMKSELVELLANR